MARLAAVLAVFALLFSAEGTAGQDAGAPPPPETGPSRPGDDRLPVNKMIETWMSYSEGERTEARGYLHERITPQAQRLYRYEYLNEGDVTMVKSTEGGEPRLEHWSWTINAQLEDDFDPFQMEASVTLGGVQWRIEIRTVGDERILDVTLPRSEELPAGDVRTLKFGTDQQVAFLPALLMYQMRQNGDLSKAGRHPWRLAGASGAGESMVVVKVEDTVPRDYLGQRGVRVTPVVLENVPSDVQLPVPFRMNVDKFGRIVEAVTRDDGRFLIAKDENEARGGEYTLSAKGRRDPFSKYGALTPKGGGGEKGPRQIREVRDELPVVRVDEVTVKLKEVGDMVEALDNLVKANSPQAEAVYQKILRYFEVLRKMTAGDPVKLNQLDGYKLRAEQLWGGAGRLVERSKTLLVGIEDHYNALNLEGVEKNLTTIKEYRARREFFQDERIREMDKIIRDAERMRDQTKARLDLRDNKKVTLTGVLLMPKYVPERVDLRVVVPGTTLEVSEPVRLVHNVRYALVNDKLQREGEEVEGQQGVVIEKIQPSSITISYKGEVREVLLKKR